MRASSLPDSLTLHVPLRLARRGGRKEMVLPDDAPGQKPSMDSALLKAIARGFRWKRMLDSGEFNTVGNLADRERIAPSYMTRVLRLTLLAPEIVEAILDGKQGAHVSLALLLGPFPLEWEAQRHALSSRG